MVILYIFTPSNKPEITGLVEPLSSDVILTKPRPKASIQVLNQRSPIRKPIGLVIINYHDSSNCAIQADDTSQACTHYRAELYSKFDAKATLLASELEIKKAHARSNISLFLSRQCAKPNAGEGIDFASWRCYYFAYL